MNSVRSFEVAKRFSLLGLVAFLLLFPGEILAVELIVTGATPEQEQLIGCIVESAGEELQKMAASEVPLMLIVLNREKFLKARRLFRAYKTENAFSSLAARRIYPSARVFANFDKVLKYVAHELGHFETNSLFERNAELKASSIRRKARRACR